MAHVLRSTLAQTTSCRIRRPLQRLELSQSAVMQYDVCTYMRIYSSDRTQTAAAASTARQDTDAADRIHAGVPDHKMDASANGVYFYPPTVAVPQPESRVSGWQLDGYLSSALLVLYAIARHRAPVLLS